MQSIQPTTQTEHVQQPAHSSIDRKMVWLLAIATAFAVGNLYYGQPLLADIAQSFAVSVNSVGIAATVTQLGYAIGLLLIVPLGDAFERRRLIVTMLLAVTVALIATALAPSISWLTLACFAIGVTTVVPQLIVPLAASLAAPRERGRVVRNGDERSVDWRATGANGEWIYRGAVRLAGNVLARGGNDAAAGAGAAHDAALQSSAGPPELRPIVALVGRAAAHRAEHPRDEYLRWHGLRRVQCFLVDAGLFPEHASLSLWQRGGRTLWARWRRGRARSVACWQALGPHRRTLYHGRLDSHYATRICHFLALWTVALGPDHRRYPARPGNTEQPDL